MLGKYHVSAHSDNSEDGAAENIQKEFPEEASDDASANAIEEIHEDEPPEPSLSRDRDTERSFHRIRPCDRAKRPLVKLRCLCCFQQDQ